MMKHPAHDLHLHDAFIRRKSNRVMVIHKTFSDVIILTCYQTAGLCVTEI